MKIEYYERTMTIEVEVPNSKKAIWKVIESAKIGI